MKFPTIRIACPSCGFNNNIDDLRVPLTLTQRCDHCAVFIDIHHNTDHPPTATAVYPTPQHRQGG